MPAWLIMFLINLLIKLLTSNGVRLAADRFLRELCIREGWQFDPKIIDDLFLMKNKEV